METQLSCVEQAICFAVQAHAGSVRRDGHTPYILHCTEAAAIVSAMTDDQEILAAAILHDVIEDAGVTKEVLAGKFGERIASLVAEMSENKRPGQSPEDTWLVRKEETLTTIEHSDDPDFLKLCLAEKLSNLRGIYRDYLKDGDDIWDSFHQTNKNKQAWYYFRLESALSRLSGTPAWKEFHQLRTAIFERGYF